MKTVPAFIIAAVILTGIFFSILALFNLPHSWAEWIVSDIILGIILYLSYLVIAAFSLDKPKTHFPFRKHIG